MGRCTSRPRHRLTDAAWRSCEDGMAKRRLTIMSANGTDSQTLATSIETQGAADWSPDGTVIVYGGPFAAGQVPLRGVRTDRTPVELSSLRVRPGGYRFLRNGTGLVYLPRPESLDFWLLDLVTKKSRPLTRLSNKGNIQRLPPDSV